MRPILDQLESDQAILLMYLADELPAGDRAEVEQRLAKEPDFRDALERLRETEQTVRQALAGADESQPLPGTPAATQRQLARVFRQWHADRLAEWARSQAGRGQRAPRRRWPYVVGAVAAVLALIIWWGLEPAPESISPIAYPQYTENEPRPENWWMNVTVPLNEPNETVALGEVERELDAVEYLRTLMQ